MNRWMAAGAGLALVLAASDAWAAAAPLTVQTEGLAISLALAPSPPARHERTTFQIGVRDLAGTPVAGAQVSLDLNMAGMTMAENRPRVQERAAGEYVAVGAFSMGGEWLAVVEVQDGARRVRAEFPLRVR